MAILYNCHTDGDQYRITKFSEHGEVESSYLCSEEECECPAGHRHTCRHRQMLPMFLAREAVNSFWFLDWDRKGWVAVEQPVETDSEPDLPEGVQLVSLGDPETLYNTIADAVGEPRMPPKPLRRI